MHTCLPAAGGGDILLKPHLQKRLMDHSARCGKHLGCLSGADKGLQCVLSGNRVSAAATRRRRDETETAVPVTGGFRRGNPTRPKTQD